MILDLTMENKESIEASTPTNRELNLKFNYDNMHHDGKMDSISTEDDIQVHFDKFYYRWDNLIYLDFEFYIDDFLFREEILWSRENNEVAEIKRFCINLLTENIFTPDGRLKGGLGQFTVDYLELCSEYMTKRILEEVNMYERLKPFNLIRSGIFGNGCGLGDEHLVTVSVDLGNYVDKFEWNIIDENNVPEEFALKMVTDLGLSDLDRNKIVMTIRKTIRNYVFNRLGNFIRILTRDKESTGFEKISTEERGQNLKIKFPYAFDSNFQQQLGKKTYRKKKKPCTWRNLKSSMTISHSSENKEETHIETRRKVKNTNEDKYKVPFGLLDNMTNKKILFYNTSKILISKKILKYMPSDSIVINKSDIEPFLKTNEEEDVFANQEMLSAITNDQNENKHTLCYGHKSFNESSLPVKTQDKPIHMNGEIEVEINLDH